MDKHFVKMDGEDPNPNTVDQNPPPAPIKQPPAAVVETPAEVVEETTNELFIKFSGHFRPFDVPKYPEVALIGLNYFKQEGLMCHPIRISSETVYKFVLPSCN